MTLNRGTSGNKKEDGENILVSDGLKPRSFAPKKVKRNKATEHNDLAPCLLRHSSCPLHLFTRQTYL